MFLSHSYSMSKNTSTSIMNCEFKFSLNEYISFYITQPHLEKLIKEGFDLKINTKEYFSLVQKRKSKQEDYQTQRDLFNILTVKDKDIYFCVDEQALITLKNEDEFTPEFVNQYFIEVSSNFKKFYDKKENNPKNESETLLIHENGLDIVLNGFSMSINNELKTEALNKLSEYFDTYFEASIKELKEYTYTSSVYTSTDFVKNKGFDLINDMTTKPYCNFEDFKNVIETLIPEKFIKY